MSKQLWQIQFQNPLFPREVAMVSQKEIATFEELAAWFHDVQRRRKAEMPPGWVWHFCNEEHELFVMVLATEPTQ